MRLVRYISYVGMCGIQDMVFSANFKPKKSDLGRSPKPWPFLVSQLTHSKLNRYEEQTASQLDSTSKQVTVGV